MHAHFIISTRDAIAYSKVISECRDRTRIADLMPKYLSLRRGTAVADRVNHAPWTQGDGNGNNNELSISNAPPRNSFSPYPPKIFNGVLIAIEMGPAKLTLETVDRRWPAFGEAFGSNKRPTPGATSCAFRFRHQKPSTPTLIDYPVAIVLIGAPFVLQLGRSSPIAMWLSVVTGVAAFSACRDHQSPDGVNQACSVLDAPVGRSRSRSGIHNRAFCLQLSPVLMRGTHWVLAAAVILTTSVLNAPGRREGPTRGLGTHTAV